MIPGHIAAGGPGGKSRRSEAAFTINEVLVGLTIFLLAVAGVLMCQWFGMIMTESTNSRVTDNDKARRFLAQLNADLMTAKTVSIGTGALSSFAMVGPNLTQSANSIQINSSTNTNQYVRYYQDSSDLSLKRITYATNKATAWVTGVVNTAVFSLQNYAGVVLTNSQNNCVVGLNLKIHEWQATLRQHAGTNNYVDYNLHTKITLRPTP